MSVGVENGTPIVNRVLTDAHSPLPPFATSNQDKLKEIAAGLGLDLSEIQNLNIDVPEIQSTDPTKVASAKAIAAYEAAGGKPVIIEDTSLTINALAELLQPTFVRYWGASRANREKICQMLVGSGDRGAFAQTIFAVYDGEQVHLRTGRVFGRIADIPQGPSTFAWDDIFIPDNQHQLEGWDGTPRTFAQMKPQEKQEISMRQEALQKILEDPYALGIMVHALGPTLEMELEAIDDEYFRGEEMAMARKHAFGLRALEGMEPNEDLAIDPPRLVPFHEVYLHPEITQITLDPKSPDLGLLITGYDTRKTIAGKNTRIMTNPDGRPPFLQHGPESYKRALAARAYEYALHHNPEMYAKLRKMLAGEKTAERPNVHSHVIEGLLKSEIIENGSGYQEVVASNVPGFTDLAYARQYSAESMSRTAAAMNHILNRNGIPTSIFALGGMPPVTGSRDVVTTAALSFMRSYIPHNSLFVDFDRRKRLFEESKEYVEEMIPGENNEDIRRLAVAQIGICISGNNMEEIASQTEQAIDIGCRSLRIYTTNPGPEVVDAARAVGETWRKKNSGNESLPFHLCVSPIVDATQAKELLAVAKEYGLALTLLAGHGGGENCTSLEGGAAANAQEIIYELSLNTEFNDVSLGFEGGLGTWFGPWLGRIEQISKDGSMVSGCVETQGGLAVLHSNGSPVQPYSGTASPWTQMLEETLFPGLVSRTNPAGQLKNNEGKPGYMAVNHWATSTAHYMYSMRSVFGRALADQRSRSIDERIAHIIADDDTLRMASATAVATAKSHRPM